MAKNKGLYGRPLEKVRAALNALDTSPELAAHNLRAALGFAAANEVWKEVERSSGPDTVLALQAALQKYPAGRTHK